MNSFIPRKFFITGTDTAVGKTTVACHLLNAMTKAGYTTLALKPVASGAAYIHGCLRNEDALLLQQHATLSQRYDEVNPIVFEDPIAPNIAACQKKFELNVEAIYQACRPTLMRKADCLIVEGAGGWSVPLNDAEYFSDLAIRFAFPVIVVIALRLGCINHAMLTMAQIKRSALTIAGWYANAIDPEYSTIEETLLTLKKHLAYPMLGYLPHRTKSSETLDNST